MIVYIKYALICILLIIAIYTDTREYKIKNNMLVVFVSIGLILSIYQRGGLGISQWAIGLLLPFAILFMLYVLRVLGAGDIKLICTIGCITGIQFIREASLYICIAAGIMAIIKMYYHGNFFSRMKHLFNYLRLSLLTKEVREYDDLHSEDKSHVIRLSYAIGLGCIYQILLELNDIYAWIS